MLGIATCDKGLPAMMMAVAGLPDLPCVIVPGGVTLPAAGAEDAGTVANPRRALRAWIDFIAGSRRVGLAARADRPAGGCQCLGTAATSQVVSEALGLSLPHLGARSVGSTGVADLAKRSARALHQLDERQLKMRDILLQRALRMQWRCTRPSGGSTNLVAAHSRHRPRRRVKTSGRGRLDFGQSPRAALVSVLPNGPIDQPTVRVFLAAGVPEVMLHLRRLGLLNTEAMTITGKLWVRLEWWEKSERRTRFRDLLKQYDGVDADEGIFPSRTARARGLTGTMVFAARQSRAGKVRS